MVIVIDTRERLRDQIYSILAMLPDVPEVREEALDYGDYHLSNGSYDMRIERKSIADFCASYRELKPRLHHMRTSWDRTSLLLEGHYIVRDSVIYLPRGTSLVPSMSYKTFSNFLMHQQELGTCVYYTMGLEESVQRLVLLHNYLPSLGEPRPALKCKTPTELFVQLPYVGSKGVKKLQEQYATPQDALVNLPTKTKKFLERW